MANVEMPKDEKYPSNSNKSKQSTEPDKKDIQPVAKAKVRKKSFGKKFASSVVSEDSSKNAIVDYILYDVLVPAAKNTISDAVTGGIEMLLFGEKRSKNSRVGRSRGTSYVIYTGYSSRRDDRDRDRPMGNRSNKGWNDDVIFDSRAEGERVIDSLIDLADQYDYASIADLYSLVGIDSQHTDYNYGWTLPMLYKATITRERTGYFLNIPRAVNIKD